MVCQCKCDAACGCDRKTTLIPPKDIFLSQATASQIMLNRTLLNQTTNVSYPFVVGLETNELVATMCALTSFVRDFKTFGESAVKSFLDIAESLIIRLQDILDEYKIRELAGRG